MYYVENETEEKVDLKIVRAILKKIVAYYGEKRDFSVTFVTDDEIQELNREYREIDAPQISSHSGWTMLRLSLYLLMKKIWIFLTTKKWAISSYPWIP